MTLPTHSGPSLALAATALFLGLPQSALAETADLVRGALKSGKSQIALAVLSENRRFSDAVELEREIAQAMGYMAGGDDSLKADWFPVLRFSDNINGGAATDTLTLGALTFQLDGEMAKSGLLVGAGGSLRQTLNLRDRVAFTWALQGELAYAPEHDLAVATVGAKGCLRARVSTHSFAEGCMSLLGDHRDLGHSVAAVADLGYTHVFTGESFALAANIGVGSITRWSNGNREDNQSFVTLGADLVTGAWGAVGASFTAYEEMEDQHRPQQRIALSANFPIFEKQVQVSLHETRYVGGLFLGEARRSTKTGISASFQATESLRVTVGYTKTDARFDVYDDDSVTLNLNWSF